MSSMSPFTDSRLGVGTLLLGTVDYGAQIANVVLTPTVDSTDGTPTLAVPDPLPEEKESWALEGSAIQDFELATGFVNYCFDNAGAVVPFELVPVTADGTKWMGSCRVWSVPIGGDAGVQVTADFSFAVEGKPTRVPGAGALAAGASRREK
jgi:hypothetical protein